MLPRLRFSRRDDPECCGVARGTWLRSELQHRTKVLHPALIPVHDVSRRLENLDIAAAMLGHSAGVVMIGLIRWCKEQTANLGWLVAIASLGLLAWGESSSWLSERASVEREVANLAMSYVRHVDQSIGKASVLTRRLVDLLSVEGYGASTSEALAATMSRMRGDSPELTDLAIYDANGNLNFSTRPTSKRQSVNASDKDYFIRHLAHSDQEAIIGIPYVAELTPVWVVPVSRRFNTPTGEFGGIVVAYIRCRYFSDHFSMFKTGKDGAALLTMEDGTVLAHSPSDETVLGTSIAGRPGLPEGLSRAGTGALTLDGLSMASRASPLFIEAPRPTSRSS